MPSDLPLRQFTGPQRANGIKPVHTYLITPCISVPWLGFAFVYMCDKRDAEEAMRKLDDQEFGHKRRRLKLQWAKVGG